MISTILNRIQSIIATFGYVTTSSITYPQAASVLMDSELPYVVALSGEAVEHSRPSANMLRTSRIFYIEFIVERADHTNIDNLAKRVASEEIISRAKYDLLANHPRLELDNLPLAKIVSIDIPNDSGVGRAGFEQNYFMGFTFPMVVTYDEIFT